MNMNSNNTSLKGNTKENLLCGLFAAIISVCTLITVPLPFSPIPVTMQTFAVFCAGLCLNKKTSALSMIVYMLVGAVGLPVFSGFNFGIGVLIGVRGGFIIGFIPAAYLVGWMNEKLNAKGLKLKTAVAFVSCILGITVVYFFGIIQFMAVSGNNLATSLSLAVIPFILPDLFKIAVAVLVYIRIEKYI